MHMVSVSKFRKEQEIYRNSLPYYKSALLMLHNLPGTSKAEDDVPILWGSPEMSRFYLLLQANVVCVEVLTITL